MQPVVTCCRRQTHRPASSHLSLFSSRPRGAIDSASGVHLRLYFLQKPDFVNPDPAPKESRLSELADRRFLTDTSDEIQAHYQVGQ